MPPISPLMPVPLGQEMYLAVKNIATATIPIGSSLEDLRATWPNLEKSLETRPVKLQRKVSTTERERERERRKRRLSRENQSGFRSYCLKISCDLCSAQKHPRKLITFATFCILRIPYELPTLQLRLGNDFVVDVVFLFIVY